MKRDLRNLSDHVHGLLIIGGGIYGATAARDAVLRGLSVALVEKGDFGGATSMNSLKTVHGGLRYLQQLDFARMRESIGERNTLMRIAPHLVQPIPFLIPTYGHLQKGREALFLALKITDLVGFDRNRGLDPSRSIAPGKTISVEECRRLIPGIRPEGLTGGAIWHDCLMYSTERLLLSFLQSAALGGAALANYMEASRFIIEKGTVKGVIAQDLLTGEELEIRAKVTLNLSGPWLNQVVGNALKKPSLRLIHPSKAMNIVVKQIFEYHAVGLPSSHTYYVGERAVRTGSRYLFTIPWRGHTIIGTTHLPYDGSPDEFRVTDDDITQFLEEVNNAYPALGLGRDDVLFAYGGLLPMTPESVNRDMVDLVKHYRILDHGKEDGLEGLISVVGVKYTTARDVAEKAVDCVFRKLGFSPTKSHSAQRPVYGGDIDRFDAFVTESKKDKPAEMSDDAFDYFLHCYGSHYRDVLASTGEAPSLMETLSESRPVTGIQVVHAVREEMAVRLSDIVMRRTELGSTGSPGRDALESCARLMGTELGWSSDRLKQELAEVNSLFANFRN